MNVFLANLFLFIHILFMLMHANDFLNFIKIMNWVFAIEVSIFGCENTMVEKVFERILKFM